MHSLRARSRAACGALALLLAALPGCVGYEAPVKPPPGLIYTDFSAPLMTDFRETKVGETNLKKTSASGTRYLGFWFISSLLSFGWRENAIQQIAEKGGISEVAYADYEFFSILGIYARMTVNVYGN